MQNPPITRASPCPVCHGRGKLHWHPYWDNGYTVCEACLGTGQASSNSDNRRIISNNVNHVSD
ncbi:hypothetical protein FJU08_01435 [Martelella alba]|uniref:DNA primase/helicase Gp4 N-terminal Bacteriophage T7-like domain-containing protein n=1 Tax=Martelella alba TaxID=2590451 RepID=A0A506UIU5_9HYPH|nr:hypothetical protein FJU08_01435 [Martelella alba]